MGVYSLALLFMGILIIGLVYARVNKNDIYHHLLFVVILFVFLVFFFAVHHHFEKTCGILIAGNLNQTVKLIRSWGVAAPLMSILLMVSQAVVAPLPAFLVTAANGMVFGSLWGVVISWTGALIGALVSFYIARLFADVALRKVRRYRKAVDFIRRAGDKKGAYVILIARLLPFISFDIVSYMAGLSGIRFWAFTVATGVGMLPATIVYSFMGNEIPTMENYSPILLTATVVFIFIIIVFTIIQSVVKKPRR